MGPEAENPARPERSAAATRPPAVPAGRPLPAALLRKAVSYTHLGGIYAVSGTLDDGRIIVNAGSADVTVALNGASIVCSYGSPLYIYQAGTATVHLMEGTENTLTDGESYRCV